MEPYVQESKKQYALVLVLIPEDIWNAQLNLPRNFARNFLDSIKRHDKELIALNPCTFLCSAEILSRLLPALSETAKVYDVETQILFLVINLHGSPPNHRLHPIRGEAGRYSKKWNE